MRTSVTLLLSIAILSATPGFSQRINRTPEPQATTQVCLGQNITLPFNDVSGIFFCSVANVFFSGITAGTSATAYSPANNVTREQMAAFLAATQQQLTTRSSRRLALRETTLPATSIVSGFATIPSITGPIVSDGLDIYAPTPTGIARVSASDLSVLTTGASYGVEVRDIVAAHGRIFGVTDDDVFVTQASSFGTVGVFSSIGTLNRRIAFDGSRLWLLSASLRIYNPVTSAVATVAATYNDIVFDGANMWVTAPDGTIKRLDAAGAVLGSTVVGTNPRRPLFDGLNIWVPNMGSNSVSVVRATGSLAGTVLATLTNANMNLPIDVAFDGNRIAVIDAYGIHLFRAMDFAPISSIALSDPATAICSDGTSFFVALNDASDMIVKF